MAYGSVLNQSFESSPVLGNYFTKEETLTNTTAALYGLSSNAVPDDVFQKIPTMEDSRIGLIKNSSGDYVPFNSLFTVNFSTQQLNSFDVAGITPDLSKIVYYNSSNQTLYLINTNDGNFNNIVS